MHNDLVGSTRKRRKGYMNAKPHQGRMEFGQGNIRTDVEVDRLSSLPDELIHKILSFMSIREAIETSVLSSRWRFIWTSMPYLDCISQNLSHMLMAPKFVSNVLSRRNSQIQVSSVKLGDVAHDSVKSILNYTNAQNVQQLTFTWDRKSTSGFHLSLFSSPSLKHFTLIEGEYYVHCPSMVTPSFDLPVLTTLHLHHITLPLSHSDKSSCLFTKCPNLKNLSLSRCRLMVIDVFNIIHPQLSNLTIQDIYGYHRCNLLNVVAPQLKNLTVICGLRNLKLSAPLLTSLVIEHHCQLPVCTQGLPSLEKADLCFLNLKLADKLVSLLEQLHNVKFLTLNLESLELLCSPVGPISHRLSPFANLKILKFSSSYQTRVYLEVPAHEIVTMSTGIKSYEQDGSSGAIFTMVSCEEIRVMRNIVSTQKRIAEFKKQWPESALELQWHFVEVMAQKLSEIEGLLSELPTSKRDVMQATFSIVCEEAAIVTNNMLDHMKIGYDKKPKLLDV